MSYDLMVFETTKAPQTRDAFLTWYLEKHQCLEDQQIQDIAVSSARLQEWYQEMIQTFPPKHELAVTPDCDEGGESQQRLTGYLIGEDLIWAVFAWSQADLAYELMLALAQKYEVGFLDAGGTDVDIILPNGTEIG